MSSSPTEVPAAASIEIVMPQMGVSVTEGTVAGWLKQPGDAVAADEPICEVTTDKIDIEIPSPGAGELAEILVREGETVPVGTPLGRIAPAGHLRWPQTLPGNVQVTWGGGEANVAAPDRSAAVAMAEEAVRAGCAVVAAVMVAPASAAR